MANREPEKATRLTSDELLVMSKSLQFAADQIKDASDLAKSNGGGIATFNYKSGQLAVDRAASFVTALQQAVFALKTGKPIEDGQLKARSVAKRNTLAEGHAKVKAGQKKSKPIQAIAKSRKKPSDTK